jgi:hypothetical protein
MQDVDLTKLSNPSGWYVYHDNDTGLYRLKSAKGHELNNSFTSRKLAELYLTSYLDKASKAAQALNEKK